MPQVSMPCSICELSKCKSAWELRRIVTRLPAGNRPVGDKKVGQVGQKCGSSFWSLACGVGVWYKDKDQLLSS